ncbi:MAG: hypothetical protein IPH75_16335 [bacterium]|nr:hypothetical protein [bacterium]
MTYRTTWHFTSPNRSLSLMMVIYLVQSGLLVYLITDKFDLEKQIDYQQSWIIELEDKLKLYKVIEDLEIGFSDDEVTKFDQYDLGRKQKVQL